LFSGDDDDACDDDDFIVALLGWIVRGFPFHPLRYVFWMRSAPLACAVRHATLRAAVAAAIWLYNVMEFCGLVLMYTVVVVRCCVALLLEQVRCAE